MLYQNEGIYRYRAGINWRAVVTLLVVVPINFAYFCTYQFSPFGDHTSASASSLYSDPLI